MKHSESAAFDLAIKALDSFQIEIPSWGFANTGTRFGKFVQAAAASTIEDKYADAAEVNRLTGATPTMALHVLWDMPNGATAIGTKTAGTYGLNMYSDPASVYQEFRPCVLGYDTSCGGYYGLRGLPTWNLDMS